MPCVSKRILSGRWYGWPVTRTTCSATCRRGASARRAGMRVVARRCGVRCRRRWRRRRRSGWWRRCGDWWIPFADEFDFCSYERERVVVELRMAAGGFHSLTLVATNPGATNPAPHADDQALLPAALFLGPDRN